MTQERRQGDGTGKRVLKAVGGLAALGGIAALNNEANRQAAGHAIGDGFNQLGTAIHNTGLDTTVKGWLPGIKHGLETVAGMVKGAGAVKIGLATGGLAALGIGAALFIRDARQNVTGEMLRTALQKEWKRNTAVALVAGAALVLTQANPIVLAAEAIFGIAHLVRMRQRAYERRIHHSLNPFYVRRYVKNRAEGHARIHTLSDNDASVMVAVSTEIDRRIEVEEVAKAARKNKNNKGSSGDDTDQQEHAPTYGQMRGNLDLTPFLKQQ